MRGGYMGGGERVVVGEVFVIVGAAMETVSIFSATAFVVIACWSYRGSDGRQSTVQSCPSDVRDAVHVVELLCKLPPSIDPGPTHPTTRPAAHHGAACDAGGCTSALWFQSARTWPGSIIGRAGKIVRKLNTKWLSAGRNGSICCTQEAIHSHGSSPGFLPTAKVCPIKTLPYASVATAAAAASVVAAAVMPPPPPSCVHARTRPRTQRLCSRPSRLSMVRQPRSGANACASCGGVGTYVLAYIHTHSRYVR